MSVIKVMTLYVLSLLLSGLEEFASSHEMSVIFTISAFWNPQEPINAHEVYECIL